MLAETLWKNSKLDSVTHIYVCDAFTRNRAPRLPHGFLRPPHICLRKGPTPVYNLLLCTRVFLIKLFSLSITLLSTGIHLTCRMHGVLTSCNYCCTLNKYRILNNTHKTESNLVYGMYNFMHMYVYNWIYSLLHFYITYIIIH